MLRKLMSMSLVVVLSGAVLVGCNSNEVADINVESTEVVEETTTNSFNETVALDNEFVKVTLTAVDFDPYDEAWDQGDLTYDVTVTNKTDKRIMLTADTCIVTTDEGAVIDASKYMDTVLEPNATSFSDWSVFIDSQSKSVFKSQSSFKTLDIAFRVVNLDQYDTLASYNVQLNN